MHDIAASGKTTGTLVNQHVDDLSHGFSAESGAEAADKAEEIAEAVGRSIARALLKVADKRGGAEVINASKKV